MSTIRLSEIQRDPDSFVRRLQAGESFVISQEDRPIAELKPIRQNTDSKRPFGLCVGEFEVPDDFDDPLPEDVLGSFEAR